MRLGTQLCAHGLDLLQLPPQIPLQGRFRRVHLIHPFPESFHSVEDRSELNPHLRPIVLRQPFRSLGHHLLSRRPKLRLQPHR